MFKGRGLGFWVQGLGFKGIGLWLEYLGFRDGLGFKGCGVSGSGSPRISLNEEA